MIIAISVEEDRGLDSPTSQIFGRCPFYVLFDNSSESIKTVANPAINAAGGAGIQAAQFLIDQQVQAIISGNLGPKAQALLQSADITCYQFDGGRVQKALDALAKGELNVLSGPNVAAHSGMRPDPPS